MDNSAPKKIALLLMAAGSSSRLGQPKQLVELLEMNKPRQSLLRRQVALMENIGLYHSVQAFCVLGYQHLTLADHLADFPPARHLSLINNPDWSKGLSASISTGVNSLSDEVDAVLIFLVDQWQLTAENLSKLIIQWQQQPDLIHIASNGKNTSPPVIFPRSFFKELIALTGDAGAKKVIKNNINKVCLTHMASAFADIDTPEQLKKLDGKQ